LYENNVSFILCPNNIETKVVNNNIAFGFDNEQSLCAIEVNNIGEDVKQNLKDFFEAKQKLE
jgi:hypothetical protein